jgi:hypothetical protein
VNVDRSDEVASGSGCSTGVPLVADERAGLVVGGSAVSDLDVAHELISIHAVELRVQPLCAASPSL